jgi:hypothetical protein
VFCIDIILLQQSNGYYFLYKPSNSQPNTLQFEVRPGMPGSHHERTLQFQKPYARSWPRTTPNIPANQLDKNHNPNRRLRADQEETPPSQHRRSSTERGGTLAVVAFKRLGHTRSRVPYHRTAVQEHQHHRCLPRPLRRHNSSQRSRRTLSLRRIATRSRTEKKFCQKNSHRKS